MFDLDLLDCLVCCHALTNPIFQVLSLTLFCTLVTAGLMVSWALSQKKLISKLLFFFKKSDRYMFFLNTRSIFKNKSMETKKILSYKKI